MACGRFRFGHQLPPAAFLMMLGCLCLQDVVLATSNIHASGCTNQMLTITCPESHRIAVKRIFYGVKRDRDCNMDKKHAYQSPHGDFDSGNIVVNVTTEDCCRTTHLDCQVDGDQMFPTLNLKCSGYMKCDVEVQKIRTSGLCGFKPYTDYMTIVYDCVSDANIATFCSDDEKRGKALYIANKVYPFYSTPRSDPTDCRCMVRTDHDDGISIHSIDVFITWASGDRECRLGLRIEDPMTYHREITCAQVGMYGFKSLYSRTVKNVTITLSSQPGHGMAYVWLLAKPNDARGLVEVICGKSLENYLARLRHQAESRQREKERERGELENKEKENITKEENSKIDEKADKNATNGTNVATSTSAHSLNSDLAAIVGGIVAAGFILIAIVIIAMALHCRRMRKEQTQPVPLELYPAVNSEPLDLASYCRYDYDDDHLCSINRSPMKMTSLADDAPVANGLRPNGFTTIARAEEYPNHYRDHRDHSPSPPLPPGLSTPPPSAQNQPLLSGRSYREVHYPGDMSLRFVKPLQNNNSSTLNPKSDGQPQDNIHSQGHTTLPANRKAVLISSGPKSPLGKRSKSVTFSQPVAMVTPLNSESEESMEKSQVSEDMEEPSYDNLNKLDIPDHPFFPGKPELIKIPRWDKVEYPEENPVRPLSTFQNSPSPQGETKVFFPPPLDFKMTSDSDDTAYMSDSSSSFWSPTRQNIKPLILPKPQKAELYETGV